MVAIATSALDTSACQHTSALLDPLVSAGGVFRPWVEHETWKLPKACTSCLLSLMPEQVAWLDFDPASSARVTTRNIHYQQGASFIGATTCGTESLLLLDSASGRPGEDAKWTVLSLSPAVEGSNSNVLRRASARGVQHARDLVRFGDSVYVLSPTSVHVYDVLSLSQRRVLPLQGLERSEAHAMMVGSSALYVVHQSSLGGESTASSLHVLERHAARSGWLLRNVASWATALAPLSGALLALDAGRGALVRIELVPPSTRAREPDPDLVSSAQSTRQLANATVAEGKQAGVKVVWRCGELCAQGRLALETLATDGDTVYVGLQPREEGRGSSLTLANEMGGARATTSSGQHTGGMLVALELPSARRLWTMPLPRLGGRGRGRGAATGEAQSDIAMPRLRLIPAAVLASFSAAAMPLSAKVTAPSVVWTIPHYRYSMLGAYEIAPLRASVLSLWSELWSKHDYLQLFPGLSSLGRTFPGMRNAKLLFSVSPPLP